MAGTTQIGLEGPPMEAGDRLTREEFERRWKRMPQVKKAEHAEFVARLQEKRTGQ